MRTQLVSKKPGLARVDREQVVFEGGSSGRFDALIFSTGYKPTASLLFPDDNALFDARGVPRVFGGTPVAEGLYFCGFHVVGKGMLRGISLEAEAGRIAASTL